MSIVKSPEKGGAGTLPPSAETREMRFEDFQVLSEMARNATGSVYKARHSRSGKLVVLKSRTTAEIGKDGNMLHEVQLLQSVDHPNVVKCYGSFWKAGVFYMVVELAERGDLAKVISERLKRREPFTEDEVFDLFTPVVRVAAYLHERGIIHRDLKALNVFLAKDGTVKVGDFGGWEGIVGQDGNGRHDVRYTPIPLPGAVRGKELRPEDGRVVSGGAAVRAVRPKDALSGKEPARAV
eukprot:CAMPEP_0114122596 /NCGR_PEP_ID=MMETSP0043_2-20121206/7781_1 /TAXON_ID=464988 /ORGANISM="Hemiselmis andersenii, Strain CCMP644" /LENGTH=237 /DNA_ID=CAMNT_0001215325 /DNA_START=200 /DNA_END=912 /DNA_ORIENTATION=-